MAHGWYKFVHALCLALALTALGTAVFAQGVATSTISGTVVDSSGGMVPGADITAKNTATGTVFTTVSGSNGTFSIPAVPSGTYSLTVALMGFKTALLNGVVANVGVPATVKAVLELGELQETVVVEAASQIVQTQATSVSSTLNVKQISNLPLPGRGAFEFLSFMPGVTSSTGSTRGSTVNGLPQSMVNITLDGMNIQDNYAKSWDGMFTRVSPRLDAVEEISMGTAAQSADAASQGGVQVRFVTRSGTNQFRGSIYYYLQKDMFNSNTWFNLYNNVDKVTGQPTSKPVVANYQPGGRIGGPVVIPGLWDGHDKAFFFINYEWLSSPGMRSVKPIIMSPNSEKGLFQYGTRTVDLFALAAKNGQLTTVDPMIAKTIAAIRASTAQGTLNATTDPATQELAWQLPTESKTTYPTVRLDYNLTKNQRLSGSYTKNHLVSNPDTTNTYYTAYPGFPVRGSQDSERYSGQVSLRSVIGATLVNEARFGATGGATMFFPEMSPEMFSDFGGYGLIMNTFKGISNPYSPASGANNSREGTTKVFEDTINWVKGKHNFNIGGNFTQAGVWVANQQQVPTITLGMASGDPADAMFNTTNLPGASSTDITNAKNLYAVLTGRITAITRNARIGEDGTTYTILGESMQKGRLRQMGFHVADSWRVTPTLTVNAGLRYELQMPFYALNNSYSSATLADLYGTSGLGTGFEPGSTVSGTGNLFKPGVKEGTPTTYQLYSADTKAYKTDKNNLAPSIGAAWTTGAEDGFLRTLLGKPGDSVFRGGWSMAYLRPGMSDFVDVFGANPGLSIDASRTQSNGNLGTLPVLLSSSNLAPPSTVPSTRVYPMAVPSVSSSVYVFDPELRVPSSKSLNLGWQRAVGKNMSVEARFIHTSSKDQWTGGNLNFLNYNELNIVDNGFLNEFKLAQGNLLANMAAGKGQTFAYTGAPGTSPLPIYLAWLNGSNAATSTSKYTGTGWTNTTLVQSLYQLNPQPFTAASTLRGNAGYNTNAKAAGLPANFFVVNPDVTNANLTTNGPPTSYNGGQFVFTRRMTQGFLAQASYAYGKGYTGYFYSFRKPIAELEQSYQTSGTGNASGNVRHAFSANWVYELPFGQGKKWGANAGSMLNRLIGSWSYQGTARLQSGRLIDFGNVRLVGMSAKDLVNSFQTELVTDPANQYRTLVYMLPQDIVENTIRAFNVSATGYTKGEPTGRYMAPANSSGCMEVAQTSTARPETGYGDCGVRSLVVQGPMVMRFDMSLVKELPIAKRVGFRFELQVFNVFNRVNFTPSNPGSSPNVTGNFSAADNYQITGAVDQSRTTQLAFRVTW